jgi:DNA-binding beta-propeller fold protein YncE
LDVWTDGSTVYAVGTVSNNYAIVAYDAATGAQQWASYYDAHGGFNPGWRWWSYDVAFDVTRLGPDLYVTGVSAAPDGLLEYATLAIDASTGAQRWVARSHGIDADGNPVPSEAYDVEASPDGQLVYVFGNDGLHALDAQTGAAAWQQQTVRCRPYWPMFHEECDLAVTPDGSRVVAFSHNDLASYDARTGGTSWHNLLRVGNDRFGLARAMVLSPDGSRVYTATPGGRDDYVTDTMSSVELAYETQAFEVRDGTLAWRVTYGRHCCAVHGIAVSPEGERVFVTGLQESVSNPVFPLKGPPQILTVAYDTNLGLETLPL